MRFTWAALRGLGTLHILNRASLVLVIVVPIMAALWPLVPLAVGATNASLALSSATLERGASDFRGLTSSLPASSPDSSLKEAVIIAQVLSREVGRELQALHHLRISWNGALPGELALLFFASLAALLARTLYEAACPKNVQAHAIGEYVGMIKRQYLSAPSDLHVLAALEAVSRATPKDSRVVEEHEWRATIQLDVDETARRLRDTAEHAKQLAASGASDRAAAILRKEDRLRRKAERLASGTNHLHPAAVGRHLALIELEARNAYVADAQRRPLLLWLTTALYTAAIVSLLTVFARQARDVAYAAQWLTR